MTAHKDLNSLHSALSEFKKMAMFEDYNITDPESRGMDDDTPLHIAALEGRVDLLEIFLPFVKDINIQGDIGNTPLHYAVLKDNLDATYLLIKHKADVNFQNDYGDTPLKLMENKPLFEKIARKHSL
ncbi:ankyrin repeat domain-containing protein [Xanthomonas phaseoli]|uniref:ankyrin repeat domain-containing protein n=1 Tax=Xanthomonas phaseoli TaxID=1985254 RepID=UPI003AFFDF81